MYPDLLTGLLITGDINKILTLYLRHFFARVTLVYIEILFCI